MLFNLLTNPTLTSAAEITAGDKAVPFSAEAWGYAGEMTLLGMGMIFAVLGSLWAVLAVFKLVFAKDSSSKKTELKKAVEARVEESVAAEEIIDTVSETDDAELVAVITAAIMAYRANEGHTEADGFRVVSFRRVRNTRR